MLAAGFIQDAVYDGPIDNRTYGFQAVILESCPASTMAMPFSKRSPSRKAIWSWMTTVMPLSWPKG